MISHLPSPMTAYDGRTLVRAIVDHGSYVIRNDAAGKPIGRFKDRKTAMKAVSAAYSRRGAPVPPDGPEAA